MLKTGALDIAHNMGGDEGTAVTRDPTLRLVHTLGGITTWLEFPEQWDPKSPWHDRRVRLAANLAIDKQAISETAGIGLDRPTGSIIGCRRCCTSACGTPLSWNGRRPLASARAWTSRRSG